MVFVQVGGDVVLAQMSCRFVTVFRRTHIRVPSYADYRNFEAVIEVA